ncbi:MAG: endonuclease III [Candidatus Thorarchaeota archaeon]
MTPAERAIRVLQLLSEAYPDAPPTYLSFHNPFEMMISTILSAHTTDRCVNSVTPRLFSRYPDAKSLADADPVDVAQIIRPCGTYNKKAEYICGASRMLMERFGGEVPRSLRELVLLPGISRKTANVVLSVAFGINEGVVVDTHVMRVSQRLALSTKRSPEKIERDLMDLIPRESWGDYSRLVGAHGRRTCTARSPRCSSCVLLALCPSAGMGP